MADLTMVPKVIKRGRPPKEKKAEVPVEAPNTATETIAQNSEYKTLDEYGIEIIRDYYGKIDPFYLSQKDPNYAYRFLRDEHKNLSIKTSNLLFQKGGWQICPKEHLLKLGIKQMELSPDGFLRRGDTILAFMPKKYFEEKEKYKIEKANEPMKTIERMLKKGSPNIGGKEIHETMKGIQTGEQLRMK